ncbi:MAG: APC family permease [Candidatus Margulisbacteria bacterium]|nr:APC family permease [Candidatus Margulisiibacteriota bacterium]MBU1021620.1 APC family permease [Candidatus Margulisiibacteriota bacterium]MBU1728770.1 APC family permease [Candidatus Margulisiibacteriota bacterium]MBU1955736.1 APC family permease [Candidatus Margulisiibacteriota bacterium]
MNNKPVTPPNKINVFTLVMITAAFAVSVRNIPILAETGMQMIFLCLVAVLAFLMPTALISAELATGWPQKGGVYVWVKEAFGDRIGFLAIWMQWVQMVFGMVMILSFVAGSLAFAINPALAGNKFYVLAVIVITYWILTLLNMRGMKTSGWISTVCLIGGVFIPAIFIIGFGLVYIFGGNPIQLNLSLTVSNFIPDLSKITNIALLAGVIFIYAGIEASASHAAEVNNPQRNYPIAIFFAGLLLILINILGGFAVGAVVPHNEISLTAGIMEAFKIFFNRFNVSWLVPVMALLAGLGAIGQVSTWVVGPVKGLLATAENGDLPPIMQKVNKNGIPTTMLIIQAALISLFGLMFIVIPNINTVFLMMLNMTILLYLIMYILMLAAGIRLRYSAPNVPRTYKVPGGKLGMWLIAGIGIVTSILAIFVGFFPPSQMHITDIRFYVLFLLFGTIIFAAIPLIIYQFRRPSWKEKLQGGN